MIRPGAAVAGRKTCLLVAAACVAICLACLPDHSKALTPPLPEKAGIVFSNGGRIVSIKADGSERTVLTRKRSIEPKTVGKKDEFLGIGPTGDQAPRMSPDGTQVLFTRSMRGAFDERKGRPGRKTMLARADGTGAREILRPRGRSSFREANWMPDGTRLIAARWTRRGKRTDRAIVIVKPNGQVERTVMRLRPFVKRPGLRWFLAPKMAPVGLSVSPDGTRVLATIRDVRFSTKERLEVISISTGKRRVVARKGRAGSWSPDGQRIVFVSDRAQDGKSCSGRFDCTMAGELYAVGADGSGLRRLTRTRADESSPSWSPDGSRIAFAANRNLPRSRAATEIYSMTPEGGCLTWLTNGSPASRSPQWAGTADMSSDPGGCGAVERTPLVEGSPSHLKAGRNTPRLWLGPEFEGRLYSGYFEILLSGFAQYSDCGAFRRADCPEPVGVVSITSCLLGDLYGPVLGLARGAAVSRERGAVVMTVKSEIGRSMLLLSGGSVTGITGDVMSEDWFGDDIGKLPSRKLQRRIIKQLRPIGSTAVPDRLPAMKIPRRSLRLMLKIERKVKRAGSVRRAAKLLRMRRGAVRENLTGLRVARRLGPLRSMKCPRLPFSLDSVVEAPIAAFGATAAVSGPGGPTRGTGRPDWVEDLKAEAAALRDRLGLG